MVTSTPLLKASDSVKFNRDEVLRESQEKNYLFNAGASVVKHYPNNGQTNRIIITPSANPDTEIKKKDILFHSPTIQKIKPKQSCSSNTKLNSVSKGSNNQAKMSINDDGINENSVIDIPQTNVGPKILRFEASPEKPKSQAYSSIDMFENMSSCNELHKQISSEELVQDQFINPDSSRITEPCRQMQEQIFSSKSDRLVSKQTKTSNVQFKIPTVMSQPTLIPIKKGGKNWRRTMVLPLTEPTSKTKITDIAQERKSITRKSCFKIEPRRSRTTMNNIQTSPINEISIMDISASDDISERNNVITEHTNFVHLESNCNVRASLNKSTIANKSSSYIVPFSDNIDDSILAVPSIDILTKVLSKCSDKKIISFDKLCNQQVLKNSKKVGEGSFGEVFLLNINELNSSVLKIVPVDGTSLVNGEPQTKLSDMLAEIVVSTDLNLLQEGFLQEGVRFVAPNFIGLRNCTLVEGQYPKRLLELWDEYHEMKGSENDRPDSKLFNNDTTTEAQRFVALEYENGGEDLENIVISNAMQGLSIFLQVAYSVAG